MENHIYDIPASLAVAKLLLEGKIKIGKKTKAYKVKHKVTPIARLSRMKVPFKMVGDPAWCHQASGRKAWESRERAVYEFEMQRKHWPMPWKPETWDVAWQDNHRIDQLMIQKWTDYSYAMWDKMVMDHDAAWRDNAAWDYHHEHFLEHEFG